MTASAKQTVVLDVMGADSGAGEIILGGLDAAVRLGNALHVILVGKRDIIENFLAQQP